MCAPRKTRDRSVSLYNFVNCVMVEMDNSSVPVMSGDRFLMIIYFIDLRFLEDLFFLRVELILTL